MTVSQLEGYTAGVLGHTLYRVVENCIYINSDKDARKLCLALIKQHHTFSCYCDHDSAWEVRVL